MNFFTDRLCFMLVWNEQSDSDNKRIKASGSRDENPESKVETEAKSAGKQSEQSVKPTEPPKQDYIHVRARRGQATDSHSLAERVFFCYLLNLFLMFLSWVFNLVTKILILITKVLYFYIRHFIKYLFVTWESCFSNPKLGVLLKSWFKFALPRALLGNFLYLFYMP